MPGKRVAQPLQQTPLYRCSTKVPMLFSLYTIVITAILVLLSIYLTTFTTTFTTSRHRASQHASIVFKENVLSRCASLKTAPGPPPDFHSRDQSDRYEPGTNATLIRNAIIFTGRENGTEIIRGDLLLDKGIVQSIGDLTALVSNAADRNLTIVDADGAWVTPGLVDLHTHLGVLSTPITAGTIDLNSAKGPILPWLRSVDGLNTHDESYELAVAGGVTSVQVLPGSDNAIGGQAFIIKLRKPKDRSVSSMILDPPYTLNIPTNPDDDDANYRPFRWRHMKQACGENLRTYGNRMDSIWSMRAAYTEAMKIKLSQDDYCAKAEAGLWDSLDGPFPETLQWEMLVDVLRGRVKISTHCYEAVDFDAMIRLSNEFQFSIASFHHAAEAYLVPDLLKRMWGAIPSVALFITNYRYKREAFRGSEFASRVLADAGIPVIMKSDHPITNSRHIMYEAQQAHYFGLPPNLAMAAVTSTPAKAIGMSHRIGVLKEGADADVVLWDSHPLQLGATPLKVWIDGIVQIPVPPKSGKQYPIEVGKGKEGDEWKYAPQPPNWDKEREEAIKWDGLPPLEGRKFQGRMIFKNVREFWNRDQGGRIEQAFSASKEQRENDTELLGTVVVENGRVVCAGLGCTEVAGDFTIVDLHGGSVSPGLMTYGSPLGLEEIASEPSTADGQAYDAFKSDVPKILNDVGSLLRAMDGLMFGTRNALTAYRSGIMFGTASFARPIYLGTPDAHVVSGLSVAFRTGAAHAMQPGAIVQDVVALHVVIGRSFPIARTISVSTQLAGLRRLLYGWESQDKETGDYFRQAAEEVVPLIIEVESADIMANLLILKADVEDKIGSRMRMVFSGAAEAYLLAEEISCADVGVILSPARSLPLVWDQRRVLPGPPLTNDTALVTLLRHDVVVGLGTREAWQVRNLRFDVQWAALESNKRITENEAYALVTTNLEKLLGIHGLDDGNMDLVAFDGGSIFDFSSKAVAVISPSNGMVELL